MAKSLDFKLNNMIAVKKMDAAVKLKKSSNFIDLLTIIDPDLLINFFDENVEKIPIRGLVDLKKTNKELMDVKSYDEFILVLNKNNANIFSNFRLKQIQKNFNKQEILDAITTLNEYDFKLKKNLKSLSRTANNYYLEKGTWSLYLCSYFLTGATITTKTPIKAPLVNIPIDFKIDGTKMYIIKKEKGITLNERLYVFLMHEYSNSLPLNDFVDTSSLLGIIKDLEKITHQTIDCNQELLNGNLHTSLFEKYRDDVVTNNAPVNFTIIPNAVVCNIQLLGGKLKQDLSNILLNDSPDPFQPNSKQKSVEYYEDKIITNKKTLVQVGRPINIFQKYAIASSLEQNTLIIGAPGTGKSEVIANLIANIIYENKNAMLVSEKKAALDVLIKRSGSLNPLILYAYDFNSKDNFYQYIQNIEEKLGQWYREDNFVANPVDTTLDDKINEFSSFYSYFSSLVHSEIDFSQKKDSYNENYIDVISNKVTNFDVIQQVRVSGYLLLPNGTNDDKLWKNMSLYLSNKFEDSVYKKFKKWFEENYYIFDVETFEDFLKKTWNEYVYFNNICEQHIDLLKNFPNIIKTILQSSMHGSREVILKYANENNTTLAKFLFHKLEKNIKTNEFSKLYFVRFPNAATRKKYKKFAPDLRDFLNSFFDIKHLNWVSFNKLQEFELSTLEWKKIFQTNWWNTLFSQNHLLHLLRTNVFQESISLFKRNEDSFAKDNDIWIYTNYINELRNKLRNLSSSEKDKFLQMFKKASKAKKSSIYSFVREYYKQLREIFPIWVMSPDIVAEFIPLNQNEFHYGIFDEASQMFLERGYPLVYRCSINTIAGDSNQLKPTSFFMSKFEEPEKNKLKNSSYDEDDEDEDEIDENEEIVSLLEKAENSRWNKFHLRNHYRSISKQLVEFSNANIYNNNLNIATLNGVWKEKTIEIIDIDGKWIDRTNEDEALEVVRAIRLNHKKYDSILVIAFNLQQANFIEDLLLNSDNVDITIKEKINSKIFITNLESVQGSEADLVLLSVGFAPNEDGILRANFGAINRDGGRNRLNVAITRARKKMIIFKSFKAEDIPAQKVLSGDALVFINWIRYLDNFSSKESQELITYKKKNSTPKFDNAFVADVYETLLKLNLDSNYYVSANLPVGNKTIDIGIMDSNSNQCALGILVDRWSSLMTAKDKIESCDHQLFLESRNYNMFRIKEYEWLLMKDVILDSIKSKLVDNKVTELVD